MFTGSVYRGGSGCRRDFLPETENDDLVVTNGQSTPPPWRLFGAAGPQQATAPFSTPPLVPTPPGMNGMGGILDALVELLSALGIEIRPGTGLEKAWSSSDFLKDWGEYYLSKHRTG